ncbi:ATP-dependent helicase [Candidatus Saccharibacteria bacterium]|nr:ATP-dependent helicase [Candidatus Saccharibacteria bacterium]
MTSFEGAYKKLNPKQREAVEAIDGPLLVIAGPGTGKTQLISTRVGYILKNADVEPSNILLLTFTDAAVAEMRKRLEKLIPTQAHKVNIYTYHGFANDLIRNNLEYFEGLEGEPIDDLAASTTLNAIIESLPYSDPLKSGLYYKKQLLSLISDAKRAVLLPKDIEEVAKANLGFIAQAGKTWRLQLDKLSEQTRITSKSAPIFEALLAQGSKIKSDSPAKLPKGVKPLEEYFMETLSQALEEFNLSQSSIPLTAWKNAWLEKDAAGRFIPAGKKANERLAAFADIYRKYQDALSVARVYDYDDMILKVIETLQANPDFKFTQAEHYQYLMLDEFQDTNPAQFALVQLLSDHPVHEGRPNVLAVGDDDQAIYAFQGADHANMKSFADFYRDVTIISLEQNYRSHQDIVDSAAGIAQQIQTRLHHSFEGVDKQLTATGENAKKPAKIDAREFISDAAQYTWVAAEIAKLISAGLPASEIAAIAPKHKYLEALLPFLSRHKLPVAYEKRENVLDQPQILMLEQMSRLVLALAEGREELADNLWGEVLSYDFWQVPTEQIWQIVWQAKGGARQGNPVTPVVLSNKHTAPIGQFFLSLANQSKLASLEEILDGLIGIGEMHKNLKLPQKSPYFDYYFSSQKSKQSPQAYTDLLSNLSLLRTMLRNRQRRQQTTTRLDDFVNFIDEARLAEINILDTNPYHENEDAVNLLSAYGAKGREFKAVFVLGVQSEVWGSASRSRISVVKLPANLGYISYRGMSEDERLRLFYVALTRAKTHLYLTSYNQTLSGQRQRHLEFLDIARGDNDKLTSNILPARFAKLTQDDSAHLETSAAQDYWGGRHLPGYKPSLKNLLLPKLEDYKLSATHLNSFIDLENMGPKYFFIYNLLNFRQAPSTTSAFGTAMHDALAWSGNKKAKDGKLPATSKVIERFYKKLDGGWLREDERQILRERGAKAIPVWLTQIGPQLQPSDKYEKNFSSEGVVLNGAKLTGKVDRLIINSKKRSITVVDIKTGKSYSAWKRETKTHKFRQQLMFYKLLVEGSSAYKGYDVDKGIIEFAEPEDGKIIRLPIDYDKNELDDFKKLIHGVWSRIQALDLPDTSKYPPSLKGITQFEADLTN